MRKREEIPVLIAEIAAELAKLDALVRKLSGQIGRLGSDEILESAALRLHNFYTGCERVLKTIAVDVNGGMPLGEDWHKRLLRQMSLPVDGVRPVVITKETLEALEELLPSATSSATSTDTN
jgi:hypothetical protein